ncbi:hypothetical protein [Aliivibrio fischeri]|uniref:hypothetical protein n=1 Tax=Aliivibrio fischeri TaxID=668 RepID=UPI001060E360|nr:hypothetical protein [Aliivibrio fischeri]TDM52107.1 hypothetical protein VFFQA001_18600 [Aliivibrio fischeri]
MSTILNKMGRICLILGLMILIAACNSDSSGSGDSTYSGGSSSTPSVQSVMDLEISAENNLDSVYSVDVDIDISSISTKRAFVSICNNSDAKGDLSKLDFDMCFVKGNLEQGIGEFDLRVANHNDELITIIWVMEKDREPLTYTFSHNKQKESYWLIN